MRILRLDERLKKYSFPSLNQIDVLDISQNDVLVVCAGFEDRSIAILKKIVELGISDISIVFVDYKPFVEENQFSEVKKICDESGYTFVRVTYDREAPAGAAYEIIDGIILNNNKIWIDISGMSRFLIVQLIEACATKNIFSKVNILYVEAKYYPPCESEVKDAVAKNTRHQDIGLFLSSGVFEVCVVPELSSVALQGQPIRLVMFPSFNYHQLTSLRAVIQPSYISFINGDTPAENNKWRKDAIRILNYLDDIQNKMEHTASTLDYRETIIVLLDIYKDYGELERIVVSPVGSKMQAVAVGIVRAYLDDIQIVYPTPRSFIQPKEYTKGIGKMYSLSLSELPILEEI